MLSQIGRGIQSTRASLRWLCTTPRDKESLGLFETPLEETDPKEIRKQRRNLALRGTLDAELSRIGVHLGKKGDKYVSSHNLDKTGRRFFPESVTEGFPHLKQKLSPEQNEKLAELLHMSESQGATESAFCRAAVSIADRVPSIFHWEVHHVLTKGDFEHPKNKVVKMRVFVKELQRRYELSDDAVQHILKIVDHRYDPGTGLLTLASQKYPKREDNRREIMRIVDELVKEGKKRYPLSRAKDSYLQRRYPRKTKEQNSSEKEEILQDIKEFFMMADVDGDGKISFEDWKLFFEESEMSIDTEVIRRMMKFVDGDADGSVSLEEFTQALYLVCLPDAESKEEPEYMLKQRTLAFPFTSPSVQKKGQH